MTSHPEVLDRMPLVRHLTDVQRLQVIDAGSERQVGRGEILFLEQQPAEAIYAVITGQIKLVRYGPRGKELLLHLVHPGQSFAEAALFGAGTYPATAEAVETSQVWCLTRQRLEGLIRSSPELGLAMVASVSKWTRVLASKLELLTQRRVEERLAIYLLARSDGGALRSGDAVVLSDPRNLIAAQCGTAPEVLSRTFRRLEEAGVLRSESDRIVVLDPDRLRELAEWIGEGPLAAM